MSCIPRPLCPTMPSVTLNSRWTTSGIDSVALAARPTPKALIRNLLDVPWRANVRQHTEQGAADYGLRYRPDGDHRAHGFRSTASTPRRDGAASLGRATITRSAAFVAVQPIGHSTACVTVIPPSRCADRRPSLLSFRPLAGKRDIHPRCRGRSWSCLPSCRP